MAARTLRAGRTYYAWSNIVVPDPKKPGQWTTIKPGTKVTAGMFENEGDFVQMIEVGSVRSMEYPEARSDESPRTYQLRKLREMQEALEEGYKSEFEDEPEPEDDEDEEQDAAAS
jgi:hypothetical protein